MKHYFQKNNSELFPANETDANSIGLTSSLPFTTPEIIKSLESFFKAGKHFNSYSPFTILL
ncbi:hypothetical protein DN068_16980 [Taibaiella soli]|uniref:Uncharacterized protein n=1 Tax=Taibaiella soli TaxID=1649169 RepID=A0A2W2B6B8_9BACT|nr:hypothetical protein DN068_16980 [Taibaiella soli]